MGRCVIRLKWDGGGTLYPIVEGVYSLVDVCASTDFWKI